MEEFIPFIRLACGEEVVGTTLGEVLCVRWLTVTEEYVGLDIFVLPKPISCLSVEESVVQGMSSGVKAFSNIDCAMD